VGQDAILSHEYSSFLGEPIGLVNNSSIKWAILQFFRGFAA